MSDPNTAAILKSVNENFKKFSLDSGLFSTMGNPKNTTPTNSTLTEVSGKNSGWNDSATSGSGWGTAAPVTGDGWGSTTPLVSASDVSLPSIDKNNSLPPSNNSVPIPNVIPQEIAGVLSIVQNSTQSNPSWTSTVPVPNVSSNNRYAHMFKGHEVSSDKTTGSLLETSSVNVRATEKNCIYPRSYGFDVKMYYFPDEPEATICVGCFNSNFVASNVTHLVKSRVVRSCETPVCRFNTHSVKHHWANVVKNPDDKLAYMNLLLTIVKRKQYPLCPKVDGKIDGDLGIGKMYTIMELLGKEVFVMCEGCYHDYGKFSNFKDSLVEFPTVPTLRYTCDFSEPYIFRTFKKYQDRNDIGCFNTSISNYFIGTRACGQHLRIYKSTVGPRTVGFCDRCYLLYFGDTDFETLFTAEASTEYCVCQRLPIKGQFKPEFQTQAEIISFLETLSLAYDAGICQAGQKDGNIYHLKDYDYDLCAECYHLLIGLFNPTFELYFFPRTATIICDFNLHNTKGLKRAEKLEESFYYNDITILKNYLKASEGVAPCPFISPTVAIWHTSTSGYVSICDHCYKTEIAATPFAEKITLVPQDGVSRTCDLSLEYVRNQFYEAMKYNDYGRFELYMVCWKKLLLTTIPP